jgi:hypothetical protein
VTIVALTPAGRIEVIIVAAIVATIILDVIVVSYGYGRGYPFIPLLISELFLGCTSAPHDPIGLGRRGCLRWPLPLTLEVAPPRVHMDAA